MQAIHSLIVKNLGSLKNLLLSRSSLATTMHFGRVDIAIVVLTLTLFVIALSAGRSKMLFGLLAIYIAIFLEAHSIDLPLIKSHFTAISQVWLNIIAFVVLYALVFVALIKTGSRHRGSSASVPFIFVVPFVLLELGFILSVFSKELVSVGRDSFILHSLPYFSTQNAHLVWAFAPFIFLLVVKLDRR